MLLGGAGGPCAGAGGWSSWDLACAFFFMECAVSAVRMMHLAFQLGVICALSTPLGALLPRLCEPATSTALVAPPPSPPLTPLPLGAFRALPCSRCSRERRG